MNFKIFYHETGANHKTFVSWIWGLLLIIVIPAWNIVSYKMLDHKTGTSHKTLNLGSARTYFLMKLGPGIGWSISQKLVFHHETKVHSKIFHHKAGVNRKLFHCLYSLDRKVSSSGWNVGSLADDVGFMGSLHSKTSKWGSCPWFISSGNSQIQCNVFYEIHVHVSWSKE